MDDKMFIITVAPLLPAIAVAYILRSNGKTLNFAVFGGAIVFIASIVMTWALFLASGWMNMDPTDLVLLLPFGIAVVFYWLFKGSKMGDERRS